MKEKFVLFFISILLIVGFTAGLLIKEDVVISTVAAEREANYSFLGESAAISEDRAKTWYELLFVKTRLTQFTFDITATDRTDSGTNNATVDAVASSGVSWWNARMRVMWSIIFQFLVRISNLLIWIPLAGLVYLPFMTDAMVVRKIKQTNFTMASPHLQLFGVKGMFWIVIGFVLLQMIPMMLHPITAPIAIAMFSFSSWIGISQFAKRA